MTTAQERHRQIDRASIGDGFGGFNNAAVVRAVCAALAAQGFEVEPITWAWNGARPIDEHNDIPPWTEDQWNQALDAAHEALTAAAIK